MTTREGKALKFLSIADDYEGGVQEGDATPVLITGGGGGSGLGIGSVDAIIWQYDGGATPPTSAATLQSAANVATAVAVGHLCITSNGDIYKCTDASNQAALVWGLIATTATVNGEPNTLILRDGNGYVAPVTIFDASSISPAVEILTQNGDGITIEIGAAHQHFIKMSGALEFNSSGVAKFIGASAAANRNAQLTELFASIPTSAGASGTLWNDGGTIKIVP